MSTRFQPWLASLLMVGWIVGGGIVARSQISTNRLEEGTGTNRVERAREPSKDETAENEPTQTEEPESGKPLPTFTPREKISVDQGIDFPVDI